VTQKREKNRQKFSTGLIAPPCFTLGVGGGPSLPSLPCAGREAKQQPKQKPLISERLRFEVRGCRPLNLLKVTVDGWDVIQSDNPLEVHLHHSSPSCNTASAEGNSFANRRRVGSQYTLPPKKRTAYKNKRYATKARDEYDEQANPGNGRLFDTATGATSRSFGIPQGTVKLVHSIPDLLLPKRQWHLLVKCQGKRPLWKKIRMGLIQ
jgi:hypothetical protein